MAALPFWRRAAIILYRASRWSVHTAVTLLTLLAAIILLASAFSDLISPTVWILAAYLGLAFPYIFLVDVLGFIFLLLTKRWRAALFLLVVFLVCGARLWRYCPLHFGQQSALTNVMVQNGRETICPVDTFRVMTFNTRMMGDAKVNDPNAELPVVDVVRTSGADVVCMQEYHYATKKGHTDEKIRQMLKKEYPFSYMLKYTSSNPTGIILFSRWPIRVQEKIDKKDKDYCWSTYCELDVRGRRIGVVNCHLQHQSISKENRALYKQQVRHFDADSLMKMKEGMRQLGPAFRNRTRQVATINTFLQDRIRTRKNSIPLLICGDMNDTPTSFTYQALRGSMNDTWEDAGLGPGITYREFPFTFRIDHVFHSEHFRTLDVRVMKEVTCSDHYPVMATFQLLPTNQ